MATIPALDGIHHLKLPVVDLDRSLAWYQGHLGYAVMTEFVEEGTRMGVAMHHPNGGPDLALRCDPDRARASAGFDYFAIGVPGHEPIEALAAHFTARGVQHDGVHRTPVGWVLLGVRDPDGHEVRFYTVPLEVPDEAFLRTFQAGHRGRPVAPPPSQPHERRRTGMLRNALVALGSVRTAGAVMVAPLLFMACGSDEADVSAAVTTAIARETTASETIATTATTVATPAPTLEGTWRTAAITPADAEGALADGGLSEWVDEFRARAPFDGDTVLVLEIGDEWDLYGESADGTRAEIDYDASYEVSGDEVVVIHSAGSNTFRWEIVGDTLMLEHLSSTMPAYEGVPEAVFQRALYMTAHFTRST